MSRSRHAFERDGYLVLVDDETVRDGIGGTDVR